MSARRKAAGNSQRLAKTGACRGFASKPAPFFNARCCSFLFPHYSQGGDCCALRATMIYYDLTSSILSFSRPRPARSHCENSGSRDVIGASARSDRAKSEVFRDRSASAGVVTRYFSPCLIFWRFWIKPKARKKESKRIFFRSILREASRTFDWASPARSGFTTFCHQKVAPKVSAGHLRRDRTEVLTERAQKTALFCTPAPGARTAVRSDSSSGAMRNLRCAPRNDDLLRFEFLYTQI